MENETIVALVGNSGVTIFLWGIVWKMAINSINKLKEDISECVKKESWEITRENLFQQVNSIQEDVKEVKEDIKKIEIHLARKNGSVD